MSLRHLQIKDNPNYLKNSSFRNMLGMKYKKWTAYCNSPTLISFSEYKIAKDNVTNLFLKLRRKYEEYLIQDTSEPINISKLLNYAKQHLRITSPNISLIKSDGLLSTTDGEAACTLNEHFASVYNTPVERSTYRSNLPTLNTMPEFDISEEMVLRKLEALNPGKFPGPDKIHLRMLKQFAQILCSSLKNNIQGKSSDRHAARGLEKNNCHSDL